MPIYVAISIILATISITNLITSEINVNEDIVNKYEINMNKEKDINSNIKYETIVDAFRNNDWDEVKLMILNGAEVNISSSSGGSMLSSAIFYDKYDIAELMLEKGANPDSLGPTGTPVLIQAINSKEYGLVELIISKGADVNKRDNKGKTALYYAIQSGYASEYLVQILLENGAYVDNNDYFAAISINEDVAKLLLQQNSQVIDEKITRPGYIDRVKWPITHYYQDVGNDEMVILLINEGADINAQDSDGNTLIHKYAMYSNEDMVLFLLEKGANRNIPNALGELPIDVVGLLGVINQQKKSSIKEVLQEYADYIFVDSHIRKITDAELIGIDKSLLRLARNEIYARHGYIFKSEDLQDYFSRKAWYKADPSYDGSLSDIEKYNAELIKSKEN